MPTLIQAMFARLRADKNLVLLLDGGTGEELFRRGVPDDRAIWSATALVNPEYHPILKQVHESFINAGSQAITTNSYGTTPGVGFGMDEIQTLVAVAGKLARESLGDRKHVVVLGSLGPLVESYRPDKIMEHRKGVELYRQMKDALVPFIDAVLAETMSSFEESSQAIEAIGEDVPLLVSYSLNANGCLRSGECATSGISRTLHFAAQHNVNLMGILFNCSEPEAITIALEAIKANVGLSNTLSKSRVLLGAYANRLTPVASDWALKESVGPQPMRDDLDPERYYIDFVSSWVNDLNVQLIGGCCGITPEHIAYLQDKLLASNKRTL